MTALASFTFQGFTLRPTRYDDRDLAADWTAADPDHCSTADADFWLEQRPGIESYLLEDAGGPVFFFKMERRTADQVEVHIQFPPGDRNNKVRILAGLSSGYEWLERVLISHAVRTVTFTSRNPSLIAFCERRLGFVEQAGRLWKALPALTAQAN